MFSDAAIALGAGRLAVIDPSAAGHQPMRSADGRYLMVYNGEIYNYAELAKRLRDRGVALRGGSDSEVLLETYAAEGRDALRRLRGMFAFAIWDTKTGELFCARDPFGIKPLYYTQAEGGRQLRFASERKALVGPGEVSVIDPDALRLYLSFQYVPAPATMTPPVRCLPPGHYLTARPGGPVESFRYWRPVLRPAKSPAPETPERILAALRDSVVAHLRSDVPRRRVPVRRGGLGRDLRDRRPDAAGHADLHGRLRPPRVQRDRGGAGDRRRRSACAQAPT